MNRFRRIYTRERLKRCFFALIVTAPLVYALSWHWFYILEVFCVGMIMLPFMERVLESPFMNRGQ